MKRLRNSVKAIIATVCVVAVLVGVVVGVIIYNNQTSNPNNPPSNNLANSAQIQNLAQDINQSYDSVDYIILDETPYEGICEYEDLSVLTEKYFIFTDPDSGYEQAYYYKKNGDGTYSYQNLTAKTNAEQPGFIHEDAIDYSVEAYTDDYILIESLLELGNSGEETGITIPDTTCYDLIYLSNTGVTNIFSINNIGNETVFDLNSNFLISDNYFSYITISLVNGSADSASASVYFYKLGDKVINVTEDLLYSMEDINYSDVYGIDNNDNNFIIQLKSKLIYGFFDENKSAFDIREKQISNYADTGVTTTYSTSSISNNLILLQERVLSDASSKNAINEDGVYYTYNYSLIINNNGTINEKQINLLDGYGMLTARSISDNSNNFYVCQQKLENNELVEEYVSQYYDINGNLLFQYTSNYNEMVRYIDDGYCVTQSGIFLIEDQQIVKNIINFAESGISAQLSQFNSPYFICTYNGYNTIMNVKGEFIISPQDLALTKILSIGENYAIGYAGYSEYKEYYLINLSSRTYSLIEDFYEDATILASIENGSSIYLTQTDGKFAVHDYSTTLFEDVESYNVLTNNNGILIEILDGNDIVLNTINCNCGVVYVEENQNITENQDNNVAITSNNTITPYAYSADNWEFPEWNPWVRIIYYYPYSDSNINNPDSKDVIIQIYLYIEFTLIGGTTHLDFYVSPYFYITNISFRFRFTDFGDYFVYTVTSDGYTKNIKITTTNSTAATTYWSTNNAENPYGGITYSLDHVYAPWFGFTLGYKYPTDLYYDVNYKGVERTLTLNANGGEVRDTDGKYKSSIQKTIEHSKEYPNANFVLPTASREGYSFTGWYYSRSDASLSAYDDEYFEENNIDKPMPVATDNTFVCDAGDRLNGNLTIYAGWTPNKYKVEFRINDGTASSSEERITQTESDYISVTGYDQSIRYSLSFRLLKNTFRRTGYSFVGWNTARDGSGDSYQDEAIVRNLTSVNNGTVTLYAQWEPIGIIVRFELAWPSGGDRHYYGFPYEYGQEEYTNNFVQLDTYGSFGISIDDNDLRADSADGYVCGGTDNSNGYEFSFTYDVSIGTIDVYNLLDTRFGTNGFVSNFWDDMLLNGSAPDKSSALIKLNSTYQIAEWLLRFNEGTYYSPARGGENGYSLSINDILNLFAVNMDESETNASPVIIFRAAYLPKSYFVDVAYDSWTYGSTESDHADSLYQLNEDAVQISFADGITATGSNSDMSDNISGAQFYNESNILGRRFDVKSMQNITFTLTINESTGDLYRFKQIEIRHVGYSYSSQYRLARIYINFDDNNNITSIEAYRENNSNGTATTTRLSSPEFYYNSGTYTFYLGGNNSYNSFSITNRPSNLSQTITIRVQNCYFAHSENESDASGFSYTQNDILSDGLFGFKVIAHTRSNYYLDAIETEISSQSTDIIGDGEFLSLNVQPVVTIEDEDNNGNERYFVWFNGVRYEFRSRPQNRYYYQVYNGSIGTGSLNGSLDASNEFYYYDDLIYYYADSSASGSSGAYYQNYNNSQIIAIRPDQTFINATQNYDGNLSSDMYYELSSYLSGISINGTNYLFTVSRPYSNGSVEDLTMTETTNSWRQLTIPTSSSTYYPLKNVNYLGTTYLVLFAFERTISSTDYTLYFTWNVSTHEVMYFLYINRKTNTSDIRINLTFNKFNNNISITVSSGSDDFGNSDLFAGDDDSLTYDFKITKDDESDRTGEGITGGSEFTIQPSHASFFKFAPKDGYLINSITVLIAGERLLQLSLNRNSFGLGTVSNSYYYLDGSSPSYNITYTRTGYNYLQYYEVHENNQYYRYGIYFSDFYTNSWKTGSSNSFGLETFYLMIAGVYDDIEISITTISYIEFDFVDSAVNNRLENLNVSTSSTTLSDRLQILVMPSGYGDWTHVSNIISTTSENRLIVRNLALSGNNYVHRVIFLGWATLFENGFKIYASGEDYSLYFTQPSVYSDGDNPLRTGFNGGSYGEVEGRKTSNVSLGNQIDLSDLLTYIYMRVNSGRNPYYINDFFECVDTEKYNNVNYEHARKYLLTFDVGANQISLTTNSYIYNANLSYNSSSSGETSHNQSGSPSDIVYYNNEKTGDIYLSWRDDNNTIRYYQLDYTNNGYSKVESWFNDTTITNIEIYNSFYGFDTGINWQDIIKENAGINSNRDGQQMSGYRLSYRYYEIPGYYLQYIDIVTADFGIVSIPVASLKTDRTNNTIETQIRDASGNETRIYIYITYNTNYGDPYYEVIFYDSSISELKNAENAIALISNNISVNFYSMAYSVSVNYYANVGNSSSASTVTNVTTGSNVNNVVINQVITYDSMTEISPYLTMTGYTFIGWASGQYVDRVDNDTVKNRYDEFTNTWNSSSSWLSVSDYFDYNNRDTLLNFKTLSSTLSYDFYIKSMQEHETYFLTDTGSSVSENYNFWAAYALLFSSNVGSTVRNNTFSSINLYGIWKANTYILTYDFNDSNTVSAGVGNGSTSAYASFNGSDFVYSQLEIGNLSPGIYSSNEFANMYYFYVKFDSSEWYAMNAQEAIDELGNRTLSNSTLGEIIVDNNEIQYVIDRYGYTWLGWFSADKSNAFEGYSNSITSDNMIFGSKYYNTVMGNSGIPTFDINLYHEFEIADNIHDDVDINFRYRDKNNVVGNYVFFYMYDGSTATVRNDPDIGTYSYYYSDDYLNVIMDNYGMLTSYDSFNNRVSNYFSYFDISVAYDAYVLNNNNNTFELIINRDEETNNRYIRLYAYWEVNRYTAVFDWRDSDTGLSASLDHIGSTIVENKTFSIQAYFDDNNSIIYNEILGFDNDYQTFNYQMNNANPVRIGYDFLGWSLFFYNYRYSNVPISGYDANDLNLGNTVYNNSVYNLDNTLLSRYVNTSGNTLIPLYDVNNMISGNASFNGDQETLGEDKDLGGASNVRSTHYIYVFALWQKQTFYANLSLNIDQEELINLYEQDSRFALAFYNSLYTLTAETRNYTNYSLAVNSNYLKESLNDAQFTFSDIIANINLIFTFDDLVQDAYIRINNNRYYLKDLFAVSTGYYFLGWLLKSDDPTSIVVANTLKTTFANDGTLNNIYEDGYSDIGQMVDGSWSANDLYFDINFYNKIYRSNYKTPTTNKDFLNDNLTQVNTINFAGASTNFGYVTIGGENYYITCEDITGSSGTINHYLYFKYNGTKYYIRVYSGLQGNLLENDHEFLYYIADGNRYPVSFDSDGGAYYTNSTLGEKVSLNNLGILIYENTSFIEGSNIISIDGQPVLFTSCTTRQFSLYAHWEFKTDFTITINNGNNASDEEANATSNPGLAGYYTIQNTDKYQSTSTGEEYADNDKYESLSLTYDFYNDLVFDIIPFYNGRFLSEMSFTFYRIEEYTVNSELRYRTTNYTLTFKFSWDNVNKSIVLQNIERTTNGVVNGEVGNRIIETNGIKNVLFNDTVVEPLLSIIDDDNIADGFNISSYAETSTNNYASTYGRRDVNRIYFNFEDVMTNIDITCKFSIQTFQVDFYNILDENGDTLSLKEGTTNVYETLYTAESFDLMMDTIDLDDPDYVLRSNLAYTGIKVATISNDVASTAGSVSYNVPYGYFLYGNYYTSSIVPNRPVDQDGTVDQPYNGYEYIYANGYYNYGATETPIASDGTDSYFDQCSPILGNKVSFPTKSMRLSLSFYSFKGWYEYSLDTDGESVLFTEYVRENEETYINRNITLYGYYYALNRPTSIQFYTWNDETNSYVLYTNNTDEYTLNSNTESSPFTNDNGTLIAKGGQAEYVDESNYAKLNITVQYGFNGLGFEDQYTSQDFSYDVSSGGSDYNTLRTLVRTYWFYQEFYEVLYFENGDGSRTYICYDSATDQFYYLDSGNHRILVNVTTIDNENYDYNVVGSSESSDLEIETIYRYNFPGAKVYVNIGNRYYEFKEITYVDETATNLPEDSEWAIEHRPRYYVEIQGNYYYWLPIQKTVSAASRTLYDSNGNTTTLGFSYTITTLDAYTVIYENEYYEISYPTADDEGGSPYVNPEVMPGTVEILVNNYLGTYYFNYTNQTLCTSQDLSTRVDFTHRIYCPVNDNYTINVRLTTGSAGSQTWTSSGITINSLPSPNIGFWYNSEEYGFIGYIHMTDAILLTLKANAVDSETGEVTESGAIYTEFSNYIDVIHADKDPLYRSNLKMAVAELVSDLTLEQFLSSLLVADSYVYSDDGSTIDSVIVNVPVNFYDIEFLDENGELQRESLSILVKVEFNIISRQTVIDDRIYAIPIYSPYIMNFTPESVETNASDNSQIDIDSTQMDVWHFEPSGDTTHVYNRENGDYLNFVVLNKEQYTSLYSNSSNITEYLDSMIKRGQYVMLNSESNGSGGITSTISFDFTQDTGEYYIFAFYYKTGNLVSDYVVRVSDNMIHIDTSGGILYNITTLQEHGLGTTT